MGKGCYKPKLIGPENSQRFEIARDVPPTQRREIYGRWLIGGIGAWVLMREVGIELADVEEILRHEVYRERERVREQAFQAGRRSALPARYGAEVVQLRRAA